MRQTFFESPSIIRFTKHSEWTRIAGCEWIASELRISKIIDTHFGRSRMPSTVCHLGGVDLAEACLYALNSQSLILPPERA